MTKTATNDPEPEINAISTVYAAVKELPPEAQARVLKYVAERLKIRAGVADPLISESTDRTLDSQETESGLQAETGQEKGLEDVVSPVAKRWMARNGLDEKSLSTIFSLGVDEIDLIAKTVPGKSMKERMRSVFLLKGAAAYLGTGAARFTHEQAKEACLHYDAYDSPNFARYVKGLSAEVSGSKDGGYTLSARGLASATEMLKEMTHTN